MPDLEIVGPIEPLGGTLLDAASFSVNEDTHEAIPTVDPSITSVEGRYATTTFETARRLLGGRRSHPVVHRREFHDDGSVSDLWCIEISEEEYRALLTSKGAEEPQESLLIGAVCPQCGAIAGSSRHLTNCGWSMR